MNTLKQNEWVAVAVGIVVVASFLLFPNLISRFVGGAASVKEADNASSIDDPSLSVEQETPMIADGALAGNLNEPTMITTASGLILNDVKIGTGPEVKSGDTVTVHYVGTFTDGKKFDSSVDRGTPFSFTVGGNQVIKGWDQGLLGMKVGGERKLTIPSTLGYGAQTYGPIPGGSTLLFDIQLLEIGK